MEKTLLIMAMPEEEATEEELEAIIEGKQQIEDGEYYHYENMYDLRRELLGGEELGGLENKFHLTRKENLFLAKKTLVNNIYSSARMENIDITLSQTQTLLDGIPVTNLDLDDMQKVMNLKNAWEYLFNHVDDKLNLDFAEKINGYVAYNESLDWGVLRYGSVGISGVEYVPVIPVREEVLKQLNEIMQIDDVTITEKAIKYMLWAMRSQLFWDGNKRTAIICINKLLIQCGVGVLMIPENKLEEFNMRLSRFYETNDYSEISGFIYNKCLFGNEYA